METSIAYLKAHLSEILKQVEIGEACTVMKHNKPIALITALEAPATNKTRPGAARGTVTVSADITKPLMT